MKNLCLFTIMGWVMIALCMPASAEMRPTGNDADATVAASPAALPAEAIETGETYLLHLDEDLEVFKDEVMRRQGLAAQYNAHFNAVKEKNVTLNLSPRWSADDIRNEIARRQREQELLPNLLAATIQYSGVDVLTPGVQEAAAPKIEVLKTCFQGWHDANIALEQVLNEALTQFFPDTPAAGAGAGASSS